MEERNSASKTVKAKQSNSERKSESETPGTKLWGQYFKSHISAEVKSAELKE